MFGYYKTTSIFYGATAFAFYNPSISLRMLGLISHLGGEASKIFGIFTPIPAEMIQFEEHMGVSKNRGIPKSSILIEFSIINHPFLGTPIFGIIHIFQMGGSTTN